MPWKFRGIWWRPQMETLSALLALCAGNSPVTGEFPAQRPVTRSFDVFFDLRLNKRLSKQSWRWWLGCHRAHYDGAMIRMVLLSLSNIEKIVQGTNELTVPNRAEPSDWHVLLNALPSTILHFDNILLNSNLWQILYVIYFDIDKSLTVRHMKNIGLMNEHIGLNETAMVKYTHSIHPLNHAKCMRASCWRLCLKTRQ